MGINIEEGCLCLLISSFVRVLKIQTKYLLFAQMHKGVTYKLEVRNKWSDS